VQIKVEKKDLSRCETLLSVEVPVEEVQRAYDSIYRELGSAVELPGFRRGKTPREVLRRHVGKEKLDEQVQEAVVPGAYDAAIDETKLEPVETPRIVVTSMGEGEPLRFEATVPLSPHVELGEYIGLEVETVLYEPTDESVERELANIRERLAQFTDANDREVRRGDRVVVSMGVREEEGSANDDPRPYVLDVGENVAEFDDQLVGALKDEERIIVVTYPEDHEDPGMRGKTMRYLVKVADIKEKSLPELTDELVKEKTPFETLAALRAEVASVQGREFRRMADELATARAVQKVVDSSTVEFPGAMLTRELLKDYARLEQALSRRDSTLEAFIRERPEDAMEFDREARRAAERRLRTGLVLGMMADKEGIRVTDEDISQEIRRIAAEHKTEPAVVREMLDKEEALPALANDLLRRKLSEFVMASATVKVHTIPAGNEPPELEEAEPGTEPAKPEEPEPATEPSQLEEPEPAAESSEPEKPEPGSAASES
jgi:trigger factor